MQTAQRSNNFPAVTTKAVATELMPGPQQMQFARQGFARGLHRIPELLLAHRRFPEVPGYEKTPLTDIQVKARLLSLLLPVALAGLEYRRLEPIAAAPSRKVGRKNFQFLHLGRIPSIWLCG